MSAYFRISCVDCQADMPHNDCRYKESMQAVIGNGHRFEGWSEDLNNYLEELLDHLIRQN